MSKTDVQLWQGVLSGSAAAWSELVRRYQPLVFAVSTRAGLSAADAADCFQQTWVALWENRKDIKDPTRLSAWLVTTARREAIRLRRQAQRDQDEVGKSEPSCPNPLPDKELALLELQAQLQAAIGSLKPRCRRVVELFFYATEKYSYEEIASTLGISSNSLGPLRRRCLKDLKEILVRNGFWDARNNTP